MNAFMNDVSHMEYIKSLVIMKCRLDEISGILYQNWVRASEEWNADAD